MLEIKHHTATFFFLHKRNDQIFCKTTKYLIVEAETQEEGENNDDE